MPKLTDILADLYTGTATKEDGATSTTTTFATWRHNSTGTPAAGFGSRHSWHLESDTTENQEAAQMDVVWSVATHATRTAQIKFRTTDEGAIGTGDEIVIGHSSVSQGIGTIRQAAFGINCVPTRTLHVAYSSPSQTTQAAWENTNNTDGNGIVHSFRSASTGVGGAANTEFAGFRTIFPIHDHATREGQFEFFILNGAGAYLVYKFRKGPAFGYGDLTSASFTQLLSARKTGWAVATGTAERTTFATYTAPDISAAYTEAEVQAIADHVQILSRRLKALIDDLHQTAGHGLIGT